MFVLNIKNRIQICSLFPLDPDVHFFFFLQSDPDPYLKNPDTKHYPNYTIAHTSQSFISFKFKPGNRDYSSDQKMESAERPGFERCDPAVVAQLAKDYAQYTRQNLTMMNVGFCQYGAEEFHCRKLRNLQFRKKR